jgi:hypothetical protein
LIKRNQPIQMLWLGRISATFLLSNTNRNKHSV